MENTNQAVDKLLQTQEFNVVLNSLNQFWVTIAGFLPNLLSAIFLLLIGKFIARVSSNLVGKLLKMTGFKKLGDVGKVNQTLGKASINLKVSNVITSSIYWLVFLVFITAAADILQLTVVVDTLNSLIGYTPKVIASVIVFVITLAAGRLVKNLVATLMEQIGMNSGEFVSTISEGVIIFFGAVLAVSQLGFDIGVITTNLSIIIAGVVATVSIALGFGSKNIVANLLAGYYVNKMIKKGQKVILSGETGTVKEVAETSVVLTTKNGDLFIPNNEVLVKVK